MHSFLQDSEDEIPSLVRSKVPPMKGSGKGKGKRRSSPPPPTTPYDSSSDSDVCHLGTGIEPRTGLTGICRGMAGYTVYAVISSERKKSICGFILVNGPHVTPASSRNLCNRSIKANALMVCTALLQAGVTCFVLVAYGMKQSLSSLEPLIEVQAPIALTPNRLDLGITYDGDGGIPLFFSTVRGFSHTECCTWSGLAMGP